MTDEEPNRVWRVSCQCGYSEMFRHLDDAKEVWDVHGQNYSDPRCGSGELKALHAYPEGGVDPENTLPKDMADLSGVEGAEVQGQ